MAFTEPAGRDAFAELFQRMTPRLYRTALGLLGHPADAADALQEAGLKAFRYFDRLQDPDAAGAWLTRIVINTCYDLGRRRSRLVPVGLVLEETEQGAPATEVDWALLQALQQLPEEQRVTVSLRFFQDLSLPQIAQVMHVPEGTVKSRLHAALGKLRVLLKDDRKEGAK